MDGKEEMVEELATEEEATQTDTFTPEQRTQINELVKKARGEGETDATEKYKGIQRTISQKDREITNLKKRAEPRVDSIAPTELMLEEMVANQQFGETKPRIAQMQALIDSAKREDSEKKQAQVVEDYTQTWRDKLEDKITKVGLSGEDEQFDDMWESFDLTYKVDGKFERVEKRLDRILTGVKVVEKPEEKAESSDLDKQVQEGVRKYLEDHNILETESGLPDGTGKGFQDIEVGFIAGTVSSEDYEAAKIKYRKY